MSSRDLRGTEEKILDPINGVYKPNRDYNLTLNTVLLSAHILFIFMYYMLGTPVLFYYNFVSIVVFALNYILVSKESNRYYLYVAMTEVTLFLTLNVIYLGWGFGFQFYLFCFGVVMIFADFYLNRGAKIRPVTWGGCAGIVVFYILLWYHTKHAAPLYTLESGVLQDLFYIVNTILAMLILAMYMWLFTSLSYRQDLRLSFMSKHDALTGIYNRRRVYEVLESHRVTDESPLQAVMIDIDLFKIVNDTYGHAAGDVVLQNLAGHMLELWRRDANFVLARWGGEEFLVLHIGEEPEQCYVQHTIETLCETVRNEQIVWKGQAITYTITAGIAIRNGSKPVDALIAEADAELYKGKQNGRDRVVVSTDANPSTAVS